jgi:hypothetical protein
MAEELASRPGSVKPDHDEQRERWLMPQDEVLTWRLRAEVAGAWLQEAAEK